MLGLERPRPAPRDVAIRDAEINIWRAPSLARRCSSYPSREEGTFCFAISHNGSHMSGTHVGSNALS